MSDDLCVLTVHAHPDDEASKGAGTIARYHSEGIRTVLVCCTGGEEGDIHNPAMERPEVRAVEPPRRGEREEPEEPLDHRQHEPVPAAPAEAEPDETAQPAEQYGVQRCPDDVVEDHAPL